jgi:hypothetical protein
MQSKDTFTSSRTRALDQGNLVVKPGLHPSSVPLVFHSHSELRSLTPALRMKIKATILPLCLNPIHIYLCWLIVKLISLLEALSRQNTPEARNSPNILRQLNNGIRSELMNLYLILQQNSRNTSYGGILKPIVKNSSNIIASSTLGSSMVSSQAHGPCHRQNSRRRPSHGFVSHFHPRHHQPWCTNQHRSVA